MSYPLYLVKVETLSFLPTTFDLMQLLKLYFCCIFLLIISNNANAKTKNIQIHLDGSGKQTAQREEAGKEYNCNFF